ncbi:hypothetical protein [Legionella sp.]|uniref:hypothetical protein n=1 Tax=Legionella sp. TaxID=459 RepID=UPI003C8E3B64
MLKKLIPKVCYAALSCSSNFVLTQSIKKIMLPDGGRLSSFWQEMRIFNTEREARIYMEEILSKNNYTEERLRYDLSQFSFFVPEVNRKELKDNAYWILTMKGKKEDIEKLILDCHDKFKLAEHVLLASNAASNQLLDREKLIEEK